MAFNTQGAAGGAMSGAATGSMFGPWGALIGGVAGGAMGGFMGGEEEEKGMSDELLNLLLGKREYKLDEKAMKRVVEKLDQMRATGKTITPEMYDSLYRAELDTAADTALKRTTEGSRTALGYASIGERAREFDTEMEAKGAGGITDLAGNLLGQYMNKKPGTAGTTGTGEVRSGTTNLTDSSQSGKCIGKIVTACTNGNNEDLDICRQYRDTFMDAATLRGYYMMAELFVPIIEKNEQFKKMVKTAVVDSWLEYGRYILEIVPVCSDTAKEETIGFLETCKEIGRCFPEYIRSTGEKV